MYYQGRYDTYQVIADMLSIMTNNMTKKSNALQENTALCMAAACDSNFKQKWNAGLQFI